MTLLNSRFIQECAIPIENSHQLVIADIRFPDTDSVPAVIPRCLYRLMHSTTLSEPLSVQTDMDVRLIVDNRLLRYHPMLKGIFLNENVWATSICQQTD
ncbi:hypothetical protein [Providencia sp. PROV223]|uniref:hypothetical protein n=1 Tax=Providencia sp. PROV223 TaxID=2949917 RepID=UPI00234A5940|nr:hypothetical protein [Providencia sp. PROV223]